MGQSRAGRRRADSPPRRCRCCRCPGRSWWCSCWRRRSSAWSATPGGARAARWGLGRDTGLPPEAGSLDSRRRSADFRARTCGAWPVGAERWAGTLARASSSRCSGFRERPRSGRLPGPHRGSPAPLLPQPHRHERRAASPDRRAGEAAAGAGASAGSGPRRGSHRLYLQLPGR